MGRLRDGYENPLFQQVSEEVVDLFGTDAVLYRVDMCANAEIRDPLYDEPTAPLIFKPYRIKALFLDYQDNFVPSAEGGSGEKTNQIYVSVNHLKLAGVVEDELGDLVNEGDLILISFRGREIIYNVLQNKRDAHFNNADTYTGYTLDCKRSTKYAPERNMLPPIKTL